MNHATQCFAPDGIGPARFSAQEFLRMCDLGAFDDIKVELDHGVLVRMNPPHLGHGQMQARILLLLGRATVGSHLGVAGETGIQLGPDVIRAFDAVVLRDVSPEVKLLEPRHVRLAVEVSDTTLARDLGRKLHDYAEAGIPTYWVVDLNARITRVMTNPRGRTYADADKVRFDAPLAVPDTDETITLA